MMERVAEQNVGERRARRLSIAGLVIACAAPVVGVQLVDHDLLATAFWAMAALDITGCMLAIIGKRVSGSATTRNLARCGIVVAVLGLLATLFFANFYFNISRVVVH